MQRDISTQAKASQHAFDEKIEKNLHQNMKPKQIQPNPKKNSECFNMTPTLIKPQKNYSVKKWVPKIGAFRSDFWSGKLMVQKSETMIDSISDTVDGRNPAPPGMDKTL